MENKTKFAIALLSVLLLSGAVAAQTPGVTSAEKVSIAGGASGFGGAGLAAYPDKAPDDPFKARLIPRNSKIYIAQSTAEDPGKKQAVGFETYLAAALRKKGVPLLILADRSQADFEISSTADSKGAGWAKKIFLRDYRKSTSSSMSVINLRTGVVAYADSSDKASANRGLRSSAEKLAKYLKKKIQDDEKKK